MSDSQPRFEHLNAKNYHVWKIRMQAFLTQKGWWHAVVAPVADGSDHDDKALSALRHGPVSVAEYVYLRMFLA